VNSGPEDGGSVSGLPVQSPRLLLRPFRSGDFDAVHAYASDAEVTRFLRFGPNDETATQSFLRTAIARARMPWPTDLHLGVVERGTGVLHGALSLCPRTSGKVEIGFCLARSAWGRGFATEAVRCAASFALGRLGAEELFGLVLPGNHASERVLGRSGFRLVEDSGAYDAWRDGLCDAARVFRCRPHTQSGRNSHSQTARNAPPR